MIFYKWRPSTISSFQGYGWLAGSLPPDPNPNSPDGRTKVMGEPTPLQVNLLDGKTRRIIDSQRSKSDGTWRFEGLKLNHHFAIEFVNQNGVYKDEAGNPYNSFIQDFVYAVPPEFDDFNAFWVHHGESAWFNFDGDQYWDNVISFLPLTGDHESTEFEDLKGQSWDHFGTAHISTSEPELFGGGILSLDGSTAYLRNDNIAVGLAGLDTFTVEIWGMKKGPGTERGYIMSMNTSSGGNRFLVGDGSTFNGQVDIPHESFPVDGQYYHLAFVLDQGIGRIFFNGRLQDQRATNMIVQANDRFSLGQEFDSNNATNFFDGNLGYFRATAGVARYANDFIPEQPFSYPPE